MSDPTPLTTGAARVVTHVVTRDVTPEECWWLAETVPAGTPVYRCRKPTYGAVKDFPATLDPEGGYPFFELPHDAVRMGEPQPDDCLCLGVNVCSTCDDETPLSDDDPRYRCIACRRVVDPELEPSAGEPLRCPDCHADAEREAR